MNVFWIQPKVGCMVNLVLKLDATHSVADEVARLSSIVMGKQHVMIDAILLNREHELGPTGENTIFCCERVQKASICKVVVF